MNYDGRGQCTGTIYILFFLTTGGFFVAYLICQLTSSLRQAIEHVERPGESQEASGRKKKTRS